MKIIMVFNRTWNPLEHFDGHGDLTHPVGNGVIPHRLRHQFPV